MDAELTSIQLDELTDIVDGVRRAPRIDLGEVLTDPNSRRTLQAQRATDGPTLDQACSAAGTLSRSNPYGWAPVQTRIKLLDAIASELSADPLLDDIATVDSVNTGIPRMLLRQFVTTLPSAFTGAINYLQSADIRQPLPGTGGTSVWLHRLPWGPAVIVPPWNMPTLTAAKKTAFALAAGCPTILCPSQWAPSGSGFLANAIARAVENLDLPSAIFQLVHGGVTTALTLAGDPRVRSLVFTGGQGPGAELLCRSAHHFTALHLELGSNNPAIICNDADTDSTAALLVDGFTKLNGQWCESPGSVFVPAATESALVDAMHDRLAGVRMGNSFEAGTTYGPQGNRRQFDRLQNRLEELRRQGGELLRNTPAIDLPGWFIPPTIVRGIDVERTRDEIFGPVLVIHAVTSEEEGLDKAALLNSGLAAYVFGEDAQHCYDIGLRLNAGEVKINGTSVLDMTSESSQGFWGASGLGGHGDRELLRFFLGTRIVGNDAPNLPI